jgi:hypothetical protein
MQHNININRTFAASLLGSIVFKTTYRLFNKTLFYSNNNTPLRLTTVAHLRGFSFYTGL